MNWVTDVEGEAIEFIATGDYLGYSKLGDKLAYDAVKELEVRLGGDIISVEYDSTIYYFAPKSTEVQINKHVVKFWADANVRYTEYAGIEFDYEEES